MNEQDLIGLWESKKTIKADGSVKTHKHPAIKMELRAGGEGTMKLFFFSAPIKWEPIEDGVAFYNVSDGTRETMEYKDGELYKDGEEGSIGVMVKA